MLESLQNAIRQNAAQNELPEHVFIEAIEAALRAAARRIYGRDTDIPVEIDLEKGNIRCCVPKKVVNIMQDSATEIPIEEARKLRSDAELGDMLNVWIDPRELGRIQAQLGKQIFSQQIKQAGREKIYQEFAGREGEIVTGYVQRFERGGVILDLEQSAEAFLPPREIPRSKTYERGKRLQCLILEVKNEARGAPVIVSRTHRDLLAMLFEQEVPEIYEGQVRIMAVARDPGNRAKVAVMATEEGIDAVGTCVGVKGIRVQTIVSELDGEKVDLLDWSEDTTVFIANALKPAAVRRVELDEENKSARVIVPDNELSLAIGQRGQNARLAAKLTGWKVDIKGESEATVSIDQLFKSSSDDEGSDVTGVAETPIGVETNTEREAADTPEQSTDSAANVETDTDTESPGTMTSDTPDEDAPVINAEEGVEAADFDTEA